MPIVKGAEERQDVCSCYTLAEMVAEGMIHAIGRQLRGLDPDGEAIRAFDYFMYLMDRYCKVDTSKARVKLDKLSQAYKKRDPIEMVDTTVDIMRNLFGSVNDYCRELHPRREE